MPRHQIKRPRAKSTRPTARTGKSSGTVRSVMADLTSALQEKILLYENALKLADKGQQYMPGPWLVAKGVPEIVFEAWVETVSAIWKIAYKSQTGEILLYGDPKPPHSQTAGWFMVSIAEQLKENLGKPIKNAFAYSPEYEGIVPGFGTKVADFAIIPKSLRNVSATVVGEIGYHNEANFARVKEEVDLWCRNMHPVVIGVKITDDTAACTKHNPRMEVIVKVSGKEDQQFLVGQGAAHECLAGTDIIEIPSELFLPRSQKIQRSTVDPIKLDLFELLQDVRLYVKQRNTS